MTKANVEVLLVEDNPADAEFVLEALGSGYLAERIHVVHDGEEALDFLFARGPYEGRVREAPPRLVVLDIKLPKVDGFEVLRAVKSNPRTSAIPVIMLTSSNVERDVAECYRLGANSYVQKPMDFDRFRETVRQIGTYWVRTNEPPPASAFGERTS